jgi:thiamine-phosphate pyrophosphorylase
MKLHAIVDDLEVARAAIEGGATVVQLRLKHLPTEGVVERGRAFRELCAEAGVTFVVNDDLDAALRLGAEGVHLGKKDPGAERALHEGLLLGLSAASMDDAIAADARAATYIGAGPVWESPSKPDADPAIGLGGLAEICRAVSIPVVAIGGVDATNAEDCMRAGAAGVAVIRAAADARALRAAIDRAAV